MARKNQPHRKEARREAAKFRQAVRDRRDPHIQLKKLEDWGHGHCKEATKLREQIGVEA